MDNVLKCHICEFDYNHIISTIEVEDDDNYNTTKFIINRVHVIPAKLKTPYRSQGNMHILFRCEDGHFFIKSFDGHKGNVNLDSNPIMDELTQYLNEAHKEDSEMEFNFNYRLLGEIEGFLITKEKEMTL